MIINSFWNALIMRISSPSFDNQKDQLEDIMTFTKYFKETLEKNGFNLNGYCHNGETVYNSLIEELSRLQHCCNPGNLDLLNGEVKFFNIMDEFYTSSIRELLTTGSVLTDDDNEYSSITITFYKLADGEIQTITTY